VYLSELNVKNIFLNMNVSAICKIQYILGKNIFTKKRKNESFYKMTHVCTYVLDVNIEKEIDEENWRKMILFSIACLCRRVTLDQGCQMLYF
jgi:hypothetical protein